MHTVLLLKKRLRNLLAKRSVKESVQLYFLQRMERLLSNGYSLIETLEIIAWDKQLISYAKAMKRFLQKGKPIDVAFEHLGFHKMIVSYLYFVRYNGNLLYSIKKCMDMYSQRLHYVNKLRQTLRYPLILTFLFLFLLGFLKRSILPSFQQLFQSSHTSTKTITFSLFVIDSLTTLCIVMIVIIACITVYWYIFRQQFSIDTQLKLYEKIPLVRSMIRVHTSLHVATYVAMFLQAGLSLKHTIEQMKEQRKYEIVQHYATQMHETLEKGISLGPLLIQLSFIDHQLAVIFQKNERIESLTKDLFAYSDYMTDYIERIVMRTIMLIQPTFFTILALFIIFVYMSLLLPMFQLIKTI